jgi:hypothetical protein
MVRLLAVIAPTRGTSRRSGLPKFSLYAKQNWYEA